MTASAAPQMNYDISGFPRAIYEFRIRLPAIPPSAREVERALQGHTHVQGDTSWGLDHGTWLPLKYMFPAADIPVLQLSVDYGRPPAFHYELAKRLRTLRSKGVLIIGSGNVVHNLGERGGTGVTETPRDWAVEFDQRMASAVASGRHSDAIDFLSLGSLATLAHPSSRSLPAVPLLAGAGRTWRAGADVLRRVPVAGHQHAIVRAGVTGCNIENKAQCPRRNAHMTTQAIGHSALSIAPWAFENQAPVAQLDRAPAF